MCMTSNPNRAISLIPIAVGSLTGARPATRRTGTVRRCACHLCLQFLVMTLLGMPALAQTSSHDLRLIAPAAPGGGADLTARVMQEVLLRTGLVRSAPVENIPGAAG